MAKDKPANKNNISGLTKSSLKGTIDIKTKCQIRADFGYQKESTKVPRKVLVKIESRLLLLSRDGFLTAPFGKKINNKLFEIRVNVGSQWRVLYSYLTNHQIILLSIFNKKTQKLPQKEYQKAIKRLEKYI